MYNTYAAPLRLEPAGSRWLGRWLLLVHAACLPLLALPALNTGLRLALLLVLSASLWLHWRQQITRRTPCSVRTLTLGEQRQLTVEYADGRVQDATLARQALVLPWLVIVYLQAPGRCNRAVLILPDMLPRDVFRRLRVRLRLALEQAPA